MSQSQHSTVHSINGSGHTIEVMYNTFQCKPVLYWVRSVPCDLLVSVSHQNRHNVVFLVAKPNEVVIDRQCNIDLIRMIAQFST